jgi:hypothetical protein
LRQIAEDATAPPQARVAAAGKLIDVALRLREAADLTARVQALEELVPVQRGIGHGWIA